MELYLVRHGQTKGNQKGILQGSSNELLNDVGRWEARYLRREIEKISFSCCYTSPLVRAFETAMLLVGDSVEIIQNSLLIERDLGEFEGKPRSSYPTHKYWDYTLNCGCFGVEKVQDLYQRCVTFIESLKDRDENEKILIVSHSAVIRTLHRILMNIPWEEPVLIDIPNCCLLKYQYFKHK